MIELLVRTRRASCEHQTQFALLISTECLQPTLPLPHQLKGPAGFDFSCEAYRPCLARFDCCVHKFLSLAQRNSCGTEFVKDRVSCLGMRFRHTRTAR